MSSYVVLARKYRPQNFDELVGQEVLVTTLKNAIESDRLHHAYILTGIRGVGKTTTARIIAKTINCSNIDKEKSYVACGKCDNCVAISASRHQDVIEIDAASRTGVDDIREIIDSISYAPVSAKYKVYIIDEVHMLSNSAFNALLKTLEEPPSHVKFIFATTEIKKVPVTILSRCQRFDLRRLDENEIVDHLKNILKKEEVEAEDRALQMVAKMSEGSVRDSLSLLDQALAGNNFDKKLKFETLEKMLGLSDQSILVDLLQALLSGDVKNSFDIFAKFYASSGDVAQLIFDLLDLTHKITAKKLLPDYELNGYSKLQQDKIIEISQKISLGSLTRIWQMLSRGSVEINQSASVKMAFEMLIARICHLAALPNLQQIFENKEEIKNNIDQKPADDNDDIVSEVLRNFEGAKLA